MKIMPFHPQSDWQMFYLAQVCKTFSLAEGFLFALKISADIEMYSLNGRPRINKNTYCRERASGHIYSEIELQIDLKNDIFEILFQIATTYSNVF